MRKQKSYEQLDFTDDFMFCKVLENNEVLCRELLEMILGVKVGRLIFTARQKPIEITSDGRGIRLDVYVESEESEETTVYDIEMQANLHGNLPKRSRYYQGMIDLNLIERGADFEELKKSYVIFICLKDMFGRGLHVYTFENRCIELPELYLRDGTTKVFINASGTADDVSGNMRDFLDYLCGKTVENDFVERIKSEVEKVRLHDEWRNEYMTLAMRDRENYEEGREEGREDGLRALVSTLKKFTSDIEELYEAVIENEDYADVTLEQVKRYY